MNKKTKFSPQPVKPTGEFTLTEQGAMLLSEVNGQSGIIKQGFPLYTPVTGVSLSGKVDYREAGKSHHDETVEWVAKRLLNE